MTDTSNDTPSDEITEETTEIEAASKEDDDRAESLEKFEKLINDVEKIGSAYRAESTLAERQVKSLLGEIYEAGQVLAELSDEEKRNKILGRGRK